MCPLPGALTIRPPDRDNNGGDRFQAGIMVILTAFLVANASVLANAALSAGLMQVRNSSELA